MERKLILENGMEFIGKGFGAEVDCISELVFNTAMVGYQEVITDPSYKGQMIVMTYPLIGNYGITDEDNESKSIHASGIIVREYNDKPSNFRYTKTLAEVLEESHVAGIAQIDTRMLTRVIREEGTQLALITSIDTSVEEGLKRIKEYVSPINQVAQVTCKKKWYARTANPEYSVVAIDCGIKLSMIRLLNEYHCNVTIVPYNTDAETIMAMKPDAVFISNGPGNPEDVGEVIELIKKLQGKVVIAGICLGHQLIALANGLETYKLKFGHRGVNHPVLDVRTNKITITSQNHSYVVKENKNSEVEITHYNLLDKTVEGLQIKKDYVFSVQFHPESGHGPLGSLNYFELLQNMIEEYKGAKGHE